MGIIFGSKAVKQYRNFQGRILTRTLSQYMSLANILGICFPVISLQVCYPVARSWSPSLSGDCTSHDAGYTWLIHLKYQPVQHNRFSWYIHFQMKDGRKASPHTRVSVVSHRRVSRDESCCYQDPRTLLPHKHWSCGRHGVTGSIMMPSFSWFLQVNPVF